MIATAFVVAKAPVAGQAKTRLVPPLRPDQAAALQEALLLDTLASCEAGARELRVLAADDRDRSTLAALLPGIACDLQRGRGLADALRLAIADHVAAGPVAIVSSDVPGLPPGALHRASDALAAGADVVLGPALDGGYWLIAMRAAHDAPFEEIPWSTPAVLATTLRRCQAAGLEVALLDRWRDVDTYADLTALAGEVDATVAPRAARVLGELRASGAIGTEPSPSLVSSELLAQSPWRAVVVDELRRADGAASTYTYLAVPRAVFVVPVTADGDLVLVRQYRHPVRDWTLEVPAGSRLEGESARDAAARELLEETGGRAGAWRHLTTFYSSSAHLSLRSDAFLATGVELGDAPGAEEEQLQQARMPFAEAVARARAGGFTEGQTALAILLAAAHLSDAGQALGG
jgi:rSAM/selenodomain-associated transferase 1